LKNKGVSLDESITTDLNLIDCCAINTPHNFMVFNQKLSADKEFLARFMFSNINCHSYHFFSLFQRRNLKMYDQTDEIYVVSKMAILI